MIMLGMVYVQNVPFWKSFVQKCPKKVSNSTKMIQKPPKPPKPPRPPDTIFWNFMAVWKPPQKPPTTRFLRQNRHPSSAPYTEDRYFGHFWVFASTLKHEFSGQQILNALYQIVQIPIKNPTKIITNSSLSRVRWTSTFYSASSVKKASKNFWTL